MSAVVIHDLKQTIVLHNYPKKAEYRCSCCGMSYTTTRRDMTYPLATFLLALRDLHNSLNARYVEYRDVIKYAKDKYKCTPSDYSILHRWKLIKSMEGVNGDKYKALTTHGRDFINNKLRIKPSHYQIMDSTYFVLNRDKNKLVVGDGKILFSEIEYAYIEKNTNTPFQYDDE